MEQKNTSATTSVHSNKELEDKLKKSSKSNNKVLIVSAVVVMTLLALAFFGDTHRYVQIGCIAIAGVLLIVTFWKHAKAPQRLLPGYEGLGGKSSVKVFSLKTPSAWVVILGGILCVVAILRLIFPSFATLQINWKIVGWSLLVIGVVFLGVVFVQYLLQRKPKTATIQTEIAKVEVTKTETTKQAKSPILRWSLIGGAVIAVIIVGVLLWPVVFTSSKDSLQSMYDQLVADTVVLAKAKNAKLDTLQKLVMVRDLGLREKEKFDSLILKKERLQREYVIADSLVENETKTVNGVTQWRQQIQASLQTRVIPPTQRVTTLLSAKLEGKGYVYKNVGGIQVSIEQGQK